MAFDPKRHVIKIRGGAEYLPVSARLIWFREEHPDWGIVTEIIEINNDEKYAIFRATIFNEDGRVIASATKKEDMKGFADYIEKAETGSVGRALAMCGYGAQFEPDLALGNGNNTPRREPPREPTREPMRDSREYGERNMAPREPMRESQREPMREATRPVAPPMPQEQRPMPQEQRPMPPVQQRPAVAQTPRPSPPPQRVERDENDFALPPTDPVSVADIPGIRRGNEIPRPPARPFTPSGNANNPGQAARPAPAGSSVQRVREPEGNFAEPSLDDDDDFDPFLEDDAPPPAKPVAKPGIAPVRKPAPDSLL